MPYKFGGEGIFDRSPWTFFVVFGGFYKRKHLIFVVCIFFYELQQKILQNFERLQVVFFGQSDKFQKTRRKMRRNEEYF